MAGPSNLFHSYNPLIKALPLFTKTDAKTQKLMAVRPLWILGDLETLHSWMDSPFKKTNWNFNRRKNSLYRHYKEILVSGFAQSLIIEQEGQSLIQFDIIPLNLNDWPKNLVHKGDYYINFLFVETFRVPELFNRSIQCAIECISSFSVARYLYIKLSQPDTHLEERLKLLGFEWIHFLNFMGRPAPVYRIKMPAHTYKFPVIM